MAARIDRAVIVWPLLMRAHYDVPDQRAAVAAYRHLQAMQ